MGGQLDDNNTFTGRLDLRNNVVYNFGWFPPTAIPSVLEVLASYPLTVP